MRGLVIGRFQPLHKGHASVIRAAIEDCVHVVVGIGSSNAPVSVRNPFTFEERERMVRAVFGDTVEVLSVPDIHDPPNWADHVMKTVGPVDRVFGNDERTLDLFEDAGIPIRRTGLVARDDQKGATVRMRLAAGDRAWRDAVPPAIVSILDEMGADKRIRSLESGVPA